MTNFTEQGTLDSKIPLDSNNDNPNNRPKKSNAAATWCIAVSVALLLLSFFITIQYNTQQKAANTLESQGTDVLVGLVRSLNEKRDRLQAELENLNRSYVSLDAIEGLEKQLQQFSMFTGTIPISGAGVSVTITADSPVMYQDLIDIVNELKASGAEAISVNDIRLTYKSRFGSKIDLKGNTAITLDQKVLLTPIVITAIGKPETLEKGLTFTGGIIENLNTLYNVYPIVKQEEKIIMPAVPDVSQSGYQTAPSSNTAKK